MARYSQYNQDFEDDEYRYGRNRGSSSRSGQYMSDQDRSFDNRGGGRYHDDEYDYRQPGRSSRGMESGNYSSSRFDQDRFRNEGSGWDENDYYQSGDRQRGYGGRNRDSQYDDEYRSYQGGGRQSQYGGGSRYGEGFQGSRSQYQSGGRQRGYGGSQYQGGESRYGSQYGGGSRYGEQGGSRYSGQGYDSGSQRRNREFEDQYDW